MRVPDAELMSVPGVLFQSSFRRPGHSQGPCDELEARGALHLRWLGGHKTTFVPAGLEAATGIYTADIYKEPPQAVYANEAKSKIFHDLMAKCLPAE